MAYLVLSCSCVFSPFSIAITSLGEERANLCVFRTLCLFGFVGFLFLLVSGKGCGLCLWHSLDFSLTFFFAMSLALNFVKISPRYLMIGYNINVIRRTACMVVNPITVNNFASLFGCTPAVGPQTL